MITRRGMFGLALLPWAKPAQAAPEVRYWCQRGTCGVLIRKPWPELFATADKVTKCTREEFRRMVPALAWREWDDYPPLPQISV